MVNMPLNEPSAAGASSPPPQEQLETPLALLQLCRGAGDKQL